MLDFVCPGSRSSSMREICDSEPDGEEIEDLLPKLSSHPVTQYMGHRQEHVERLLGLKKWGALLGFPSTWACVTSEIVRRRLDRNLKKLLVCLATR